MFFQEINSRCQVDLNDMQSQTDIDFKFIFVYQGHLTKFVQLHALKSKCTEEGAYHLIDILLYLEPLVYIKVTTVVSLVIISWKLM